MKNHQNTTKNTRFNRYSIESIVHEHKFTKYKVDYFLLRFSENENAVYFLQWLHLACPVFIQIPFEIQCKWKSTQCICYRVSTQHVQYLYNVNTHLYLMENYCTSKWHHQRSRHNLILVPWCKHSSPIAPGH